MNIFETNAVNGYVRIIVETELEHQIIPEAIVHIILYFYCSNHIIHFDVDRHHGPCIHIYNTVTNKLNTFKIIPLNNKSQNYGNIKYSNKCMAHNVKLPLNVHQKVSPILKSKHNQYDVLFECGYFRYHHNNNNNPSAIILNIPKNADSRIKMEYKTDNDNNIGIQWCLPSFPESLLNCKSNIVYNNQHGLFCLIDENIYNMNIEKDDDAEITCIGSNLCHNETYRSCVNIDSSQKILIAGGLNYKWNKVSNKCYLYDMNDYTLIKIKNMKQKRYTAGICYNQQLNKVYIGGGYHDGTVKGVEYYDFIKSDWYSVSSYGMNIEHRFYPLLWINDNNILFIASTDSDCIEYCDLRMCNKYRFWSLIGDNHCFKMSLNKMFGVQKRASFYQMLLRTE